MKVKAEKFLQLVSARLAEYQLEKSELKKYFEEGISSLPEKRSKLKKFLQTHHSSQFDVFARSYSDARQSFCSNQVVPTSVDVHDAPNKTFLESMLYHQHDPEIMKNIIDAALETELKSSSVKQLTLQLCQAFVASPTTRHVLAYGLYKFFDAKIEFLLREAVETQVLQKVSDQLLKVATIIRHNIKDFNQIATKLLPRPSHIMSAIFSLYIDVNIAIHEHDTKVGDRLIETGIMLLGNPHHLLDSLLQVANLNHRNAVEVLAPLYSHVLLHPVWKNASFGVTEYLQLLLCSRMALHVVKERREACERYMGSALQIQAPAHFYKWVTDRPGGLDALEPTPISPTSQSVFITKYFMKEADIEVLEDLVDLYHRDPVVGKDEDVVTDQSEEDVNIPRNGDSLFFIDTNPTKLNDDDERNTKCDVIISETNDDIGDEVVRSDDEESNDVTEEKLVIDTSPELDGDEEQDYVLAPLEVDSESAIDTVANDSETMRSSPMMSSGDESSQETRQSNDDDIIASSGGKGAPKRKVVANRKTSKRLKSSVCPSSLDPIPEGTPRANPSDQPVVGRAKRRPVTRRSSRTDSESSTGNHGYGTRSRRSLAS